MPELIQTNTDLSTRGQISGFYCRVTVLYNDSKFPELNAFKNTSKNILKKDIQLTKHNLIFKYLVWGKHTHLQYKAFKANLISEKVSI